MKKALIVLAVLTMGVWSASAQTKGTKQFPVTYVVPQPCGYGFTMNIFYLGTGLPVTNGSTYPYEIYTSGGGTCPVGQPACDSGVISSGQNTNWILQPCTSYEIHFFGWGFTNSTPQIITITTDGCGGVFVC